jgi:hypothetical protein
MLPESNAFKVYDHLVKNIVPTKQVTTYGAVEKATGVPLGTGGGPQAIALTEILAICAARGLPPLSSLVVAQSTLKEMRPGRGYHVAAALNAGRGKWPTDNRLLTLIDNPESRKEDLAAFDDLIHKHQQMVWSFPGPWPNNFYEMPKETQVDTRRRFAYSPDYRWIRFRGEELSLTPNQARVVEYLHKKHKAGIREVSDAKIMEDLDLPMTSKMKDTFRESRAWKLFVGPGGTKGTRKLNLEDDEEGEGETEN